MRKKTRRVERYAMNLLIDSIFHPIARKTRDPTWWIVDGLLHFLNEYDLPPEARLRKFVRYNLPQILGAAKRRKRRGAR